MSASPSHRSGTLLALASAVGFSLMAVWATYAYDAGIDVATLLALRFGICAVAFGAVIAVRRPPMPPRRLIALAFALGLLLFSAESGAYFASLTRIDAGLASLLFYAYPALVVAGAVMLRRESVTVRRVAALVVASAGIVLVLAGGGSVHPDAIGIVLALTGAIGYTAYVLTADGVLARIDPFVFAGLVFTGAAVALAAFGSATGSLHLDFAASGWIDVVLLAVVSTVLPVTAFLLALQRIGAGTVSILSTVEPVVTAAVAWMLFGQRLQPVQIAGGALVLSAIVLLRWRATGAPARSTSVLADDPAAEPAGPPPARALARNAA